MLRHQFRANSSAPGLHGSIFSLVLLLGGLGLAATAACSKPAPKEKPKVFGLYQIGETTPADVGACRPQDDQTYCSNNPSPKIGGGRTQTDLFFRGHADDAPLVEILVGVWACKAGQVSADLHKMFGEPTQVAKKRSFWRLEEMTIIALLPMENDLCTLHFLDHTEKDRIAELFPQAATP